MYDSGYFECNSIEMLMFISNFGSCVFREKGVHVCRECGKQLSSASTYKRHLEVHFGYLK